LYDVYVFDNRRTFAKWVAAELYRLQQQGLARAAVEGTLRDARCIIGSRAALRQLALERLAELADLDGELERLFTQDERGVYGARPTVRGIKPVETPAAAHPIARHPTHTASRTAASTRRG
jgi:hypothetical protein